MDIKNNNDILGVCKTAFNLAINRYSPPNLHNRELDIADQERIKIILDFQSETPDTIFKKLEQGIKAINEGKIYEQIENLHYPNRCVLLNGGNTDLIKGIACYLYNDRYDGSFNYKNYSGCTDAHIISDLFDRNVPVFDTPLFNIYLEQGGLLFLRGLDNLSENSLNFIAGKIEDYVQGVSGWLGLLIVGIDDIARLPKYFTRQFEIINLEPERQAAAASTPQNTCYNWELEGNKVISNGQAVTLSGISFKLFECLYRKKGKFVKNKTLKDTCWGKNKPSYDKYLVDAMNDLELSLKKEITQQKEKIIESEKEGRKIISYRLST